MALSAQRFKFLNNETNLPTTDFETILDNSVYTNPSYDDLYSDITKDLVEGLVGDNLINAIQNELLNYSTVTPDTINKIISNLMNDPSIKSSIQSAMSMFNIDASNYAQAVDYLLNTMGQSVLSNAASICNSPSIINAVGESLRSSLIGRSTSFLNTKYNTQPTLRCPTLSNVELPKIPPVKPSQVLDFIELNNAIQINSPSHQNSANTWVSKDTVEFVKLPFNTYPEKETLYINKVLLYRAIYYSYKYRNTPQTSSSSSFSQISFPLKFDTNYVLSIIKKNPLQVANYISVCKYMDQTNASAQDRFYVIKQCQSYIFASDRVWDIDPVYNISVSTAITLLEHPNAAASYYNASYSTVSLPKVTTPNQYNLASAMDILRANPTKESTYVDISNYVNSTSATFTDRQMLKKSIQVYVEDNRVALSPKIWEIVNDLTIQKASSAPIDSTNSQSDYSIYLYYLPRYAAVMKEFVTNPIYYEVISKYIPNMSISSTPASDPLKNDLLNHVNDVYMYFKTRLNLFDVKDYTTVFKELCDDVPSNLTLAEIEYLIVSLPEAVFNQQLSSKVTVNDYQFV